MQKFFTTGLLIFSSLIGITAIADKVQAFPSCYGVDQAGNTIDLSGLCTPSSETNVIPSTPINSQSKPEENTELEEDKNPQVSTREEAEKDIQACFSSPTCTQMIGGDNEPQKSPHQIRIDQVLNGGRINPN
ncbi:shikimate kinase [Cyanothece sp. BG0011]|uniref:shikimate kinase n=1 Tax=Cyanothece sp. BG0011 TaxID=2082950 RepID=UPI000D1DA26C|nr:shikimate kinase [Cyanothece sp. BG0011]